MFVVFLLCLVRENQNNIIKLKQLSPNGKIPSGVLQGGANAIDKGMNLFGCVLRISCIENG